MEELDLPRTASDPCAWSRARRGPRKRNLLLDTTSLVHFEWWRTRADQADHRQSAVNAVFNSNPMAGQGVVWLCAALLEKLHSCMCMLDTGTVRRHNST